MCATHSDWLLVCAEFDASILEVVVLLRVLRLVKVLGTIKRFQIIVSTVMQLGPAITIYGIMLLVVFYVYAIIGMEAYGGRIYDVRPALFAAAQPSESA